MTMKEGGDIKAMELPRMVMIGGDSIYETGDVCERLGLKGAGMIICDPITKKVAGEAVRLQLEEKGYQQQVMVINDATMPVVREVTSRILKNKMSFALGVGGGRSIDVAKYAAAETKIPFLSVPTAASHDGIVSAQASIRTAKKSSSLSVSARPPIAVIADTKIIISAPYRLLAAGCGDIIAKLTAVRDWQLAERLKGEYYSNYASSLSEMTAKLLIKNANTIRPGLEEAARFVMKALVSSGVAMSIAGSSRPASGAEHKFSHALDQIAKRPALHGEQCGIGTIMMMYLHGGDWEEITQTLQAVGAPTTAKRLGVCREEIVLALTRAHRIRPERYTILGDNGLTKGAAEKLATITKII